MDWNDELRLEQLVNASFVGTNGDGEQQHSDPDEQHPTNVDDNGEVSQSSVISNLADMNERCGSDFWMKDKGG